MSQLAKLTKKEKKKKKRKKKQMMKKKGRTRHYISMADELVKSVNT